PPARAAAPTPAVQFTDVTPAAGIHFKHTSGRSGRLYFPETVGSGCAFLDYNNDGKLDLFLVNSSRLPGFRDRGPFYPALYRNDGGTAAQPWSCTFTDVTKKAGLAVDCDGAGGAAAHYDEGVGEDVYLS